MSSASGDVMRALGPFCLAIRSDLHILIIA